MSIDEISELGERYAREYNPESVAPFPYEHVLQKHPDLTIIYADLEDADVSGVTLLKDGRFTILINSAKPETRQHFSLGHELGHYFLHKNRIREGDNFIDGDESLDSDTFLYRLNGTENTQLEREANNFAASLLMPSDLVRRAWHVTGGKIEDCAKLFQVSVIAMSVRLTRLGLVE